MGKIGEFERTIVAEPLEKPLPAGKLLLKVPEEPIKEPQENLRRCYHKVSERVDSS